MALVIHIETWASRSKKHRVVLLQGATRENDYFYRAFKGRRSVGGGGFGLIESEAQARAAFRAQVAKGYFQPDANKTPMVLVDTSVRACDEEAI
jgi:hypothetical protein